MPLRDHFRPPLNDKHSWDELHGGWPAMMTMKLNSNTSLPENYAAGPIVHLGAVDEYEVRAYDTTHGRRLVAAIEIVSPSNKDRPESRQAFVAKAAALLQQGVCVSIVDVVTVRQFNLYAELLELIGQSDPALGNEPPHIYAVTIRNIKRLGRRRPRIETWFYPLTLGQPLPPLPIWLDIDLHVSLDVETTYEETCRALRIA